MVRSAPVPFTSIEPPSKIMPRIKNWQFEDLSDACGHDFIEIKWRIFVAPGIVIPIDNREWSRRALTPHGVPRLGASRLQPSSRVKKIGP